jgi:hypothetical protein
VDITGTPIWGTYFFPETAKDCLKIIQNRKEEKRDKDDPPDK